MKKIAIALVLALVASSCFGASASLFPDWSYRQGMDFLTGFGCSIGAVVTTTCLAFSLDVFNDIANPASSRGIFEFSGYLFLDAALILVAYIEYSKVFDRDSAFDYAMLNLHNDAYSTEIKIQGFTVGRIY
jgi:hypothetical protein